MQDVAEDLLRDRTDVGVREIERDVAAAPDGILRTRRLHAGTAPVADLRARHPAQGPDGAVHLRHRDGGAGCQRRQRRGRVRLLDRLTPREQADRRDRSDEAGAERDRARAAMTSEGQGLSPLLPAPPALDVSPVAASVSPWPDRKAMTVMLASSEGEMSCEAAIRIGEV